MNEIFRRRHLPHWDVPGATYFVTACLADSIPAQGLLSIRELEARLTANGPKCQSPESKTTTWKKFFVEGAEGLGLVGTVYPEDHGEFGAALIGDLDVDPCA